MFRRIIFPVVLTIASCTSSPVRENKLDVSQLLPSIERQPANTYATESKKEFDSKREEVKACLISTCGKPGENMSGSDAILRSYSIETVDFKKTWPEIENNIVSILQLTKKIESEKFKTYRALLARKKIPLSNAAKAFIAQKKTQGIKVKLLNEAAQESNFQVLAGAMSFSAKSNRQESVSRMTDYLFGYYENIVRAKTSGDLQIILLNDLEKDKSRFIESTIVKIDLAEGAAKPPQDLKKSAVEIVRISSAKSLNELGPYVMENISGLGRLNPDDPEFALKFVDELSNLPFSSFFGIGPMITPLVEMDEIIKSPVKDKLSNLYKLTAKDVFDVVRLPNESKSEKLEITSDFKKSCRLRANHLASIGSSSLWKSNFENQKKIMMASALQLTKEIAPEVNGAKIEKIFSKIRFGYQNAPNLEAIRNKIANTLNARKRELQWLKKISSDEGLATSFLNAAILYKSDFFDNPYEYKKADILCGADPMANTLIDKMVSFSIENEKDIQVSWFTLAYPEVGIPILAHEVGHAVAAALQTDFDKLNTFIQIRQCLDKRNPLSSKNNPLKDSKGNYVEEDWGDWFSSKVMKRVRGKIYPTKPLACALISDQGFEYDVFQTFVPYPEDVHSAPILRLILNHQDENLEKNECRVLTQTKALANQNLNCDFNF